MNFNSSGLSEGMLYMVHYFNPGHETAVQNASPYYTAPTNMAALQRELAFLPAWYADRAKDRDSVVLVENDIDASFYSFLNRSFGGFPKAITVPELINYAHDEVALWGVSPQAIRYFEELNNKLGIGLQYPVWKQEFVYLNSRQAAQECLTQLANAISDISSSLIPHFANSLDEIELEVKSSPFQLLTKAPYSSSGRGLLWLPIGELTRTERQILHGIFRKQGSVSVERALDKVIDFAMEFSADGNGKAEFIGYSFFETNKKGAYIGNYLQSQESIENTIANYIPLSLLNDVKERLIAILSQSHAGFYNGCIGVDMLIYRDENEYFLHPCVEINMRSNMGLLALCIYKNYVKAGACGRFKLDFEAKEGLIYSSHNEMMQEYPAIFEHNRLVSGYLSLCPVDEKSHYWAYVLIE